MKRVFIVGCPRSGTTLLQSMLASHSELVSFTESHFFTKGFRHFHTDNWIYYPGTYTYDLLMKFYTENNFDQSIQADLDRERSKMRTPGMWANWFIASLDQHASQHKKLGWVEKTPNHLHHIHFIKKVVPDAVFIHILRDGRNVAASIFDVANHNTKVWGEKTLADCVSLWNRDLKTSLKWLKGNREWHLGIRYEELVQAPETVLKQICQFVELDWEEGMLDYQQTAAQVINRDEVWKENNIKKLQMNSRYENLSDEQKEFLETELNLKMVEAFPSLL